MLQNLQILRAVAALLVVVHHFLLVNKNAGLGGLAGFAHLAEFGACGVDLFFCISGFVMLNSIHKKDSFSPREFAIGRLIRIVPTYWITSTLFIVMLGFISIKKIGFAATLSNPQFSANYILSSYLLIPALDQTSNFIQPFLPQGWTLSYELYFYLLLMCAAIIGRGHTFKTAVLGTAFLGSGILLFWNVRGVAGTFFSNSVVLEFALGMLVFQATRKTRRFGLPATVLGFVLLVATAFIQVENRVILWGIPSALILYGFVSLEGILHAPKFLKEIGNASYSLYLTHILLTHTYNGLLRRDHFTSTTSQHVAVLTGTVIAVLLAFVFYRFIEQPLLKQMSPKRRTVHVVATS